MIPLEAAEEGLSLYDLKGLAFAAGYQSQVVAALAMTVVAAFYYLRMLAYICAQPERGNSPPNALLSNFEVEFCICFNTSVLIHSSRLNQYPRKRMQAVYGIIKYANPYRYFYLPASSSSSHSKSEKPELGEEWVMMNRGMPHIVITSLYNTEQDKLAAIFQKYIRGYDCRKRFSQIGELKKAKSIALAQNEADHFQIKCTLESLIQLKANLEAQLDHPGTVFKQIGFKLAGLIQEEKREQSPKQMLAVHIAVLNDQINHEKAKKSRIEANHFREVQEIESKIAACLTELSPPLAILPPPPPVLVASPQQQLLEEIEHTAHSDLRRLFEAFFSKAEEEQVQTWTYDPKSSSGAFSLVLRQPMKVWIRPQSAEGSVDPRTPKGVVLILGKNNCKVHGRIDRRECKIVFTAGFDLYCEWKKSILSGVADGTLDSIQYDSAKRQIVIATTSRPRGMSLTSTQTDSKPLSEMLDTWKSGILVPGDPEEFLKNLLKN